MRRNNNNGGRGNYRNPCITMHQPWASLLLFGIKRVEGRSWPSPIRGRLWIHAAGKVPDPSTIKAMEEFYREIYAVDGITDLKFPESYPTSRLLGCVEVVGCVKREELQYWDEVPEGCLSVVPLELFRWILAGVAGLMSASFVALNLKTHIASAGERWFLIVMAIFLLQVALAVALKVYLFTVTV